MTKPKGKMITSLKSHILPNLRRSSASASSTKSQTSPTQNGGDSSPLRSKSSLLPSRKSKQNAAASREELEEGAGPISPISPTSKVQPTESPSSPPANSPQPLPQSPPPAEAQAKSEEPAAEGLKGQEEGSPITGRKEAVAVVPLTDSAIRKQSLALNSQRHLIKNLLESYPETTPREAAAMAATSAGIVMATGSSTPSSAAGHRKVWVKRPGASATQVPIHEDDLVDDVRDMILKKYANSLGKSFDAPDVLLRIAPRGGSSRSGNAQHANERTLGPEEPIIRIIDSYFPGGQLVEEALTIEVPHRRHTPRHSPKVQMPFYPAGGAAISDQHHARPVETDQDYFPVMPVGAQQLAPAGPATVTSHPHSISVLTTGQIPPLPSPGGRTTRHGHRQKSNRHASSPSGGQSNAGHVDTRHSSSSTSHPPPLPTPPISSLNHPTRGTVTPPSVSSPRLPKTKKPSKKVSTPGANGGTNMDTIVPPINVLIVEDNIINLRLLQAFMRKLKVRCTAAMNGREAVQKWRNGGFHLVFMDIQLPIMNGLDATMEIRRLERLNGVGVLAKNLANGAKNAGTNGSEGEVGNTDRLSNPELFKNPVIIVALTASSLPSDRHEALAAGCNDFLTKPVTMHWLERKVVEWGCMQALIDFDGWKKWKEVHVAGDSGSDKKKAGKAASAKGGPAVTTPTSQPKNLAPPAGIKASPPSATKTTTVTGPSTAAGPAAASAGSPKSPKSPSRDLKSLRDITEGSAGTLDTLASITSESSAAPSLDESPHAASGTPSSPPPSRKGLPGANASHISSPLAGSGETA